MRSELVIVVHRVGHWAYHRIHIPIIRQVALLIVHVMRVVCMGLTQCEIASKTDIGPRLHLAHGGSGVVVHADARIGADCTIWQHVTIGGKNGGVPVIGDGVLVGAGAVILGGGQDWRRRQDRRECCRAARCATWGYRCGRPGSHHRGGRMTTSGMTPAAVDGVRVPRRLYVAHLPVVPTTVSQAAAMVVADAAAHVGHVYVLVNAHSARLRRGDEGYAELLSDEVNSICLPDGASMSFGARLLGLGDVGRCPGPDLLEAGSDACARSGIKVFLFGGASGVAESLANTLMARYPGLQVAGTFTPPYGEWPRSESERMAGIVRTSGAQVLWLGVSAPKQEKWAYEFVTMLKMPIVCVGAAFDFASGTKKRAPVWMRRSGLEWMFRLISEPRRLWRRYLVGNAQFIFDLLRYGKKTI